VRGIPRAKVGTVSPRRVAVAALQGKQKRAANAVASGTDRTQWRIENF